MFFASKDYPVPSVGFLYLKKDTCFQQVRYLQFEEGPWNVTLLMIRSDIYLCCTVRTSGSWRFRMWIHTKFYWNLFSLNPVFSCCGSQDLVRLDLLESKHGVREAPEQGPGSDADEFGAGAGLFVLGNLRDCSLSSQTFSKVSVQKLPSFHVCSVWWPGSSPKRVTALLCFTVLCF